MTRWFFGGLVAAIVIAWLASLVHLSGRAPLGLTSLIVGALLGAALTALAAMLRIAGSRWLFVGTIFLALVTVIAQHAWLYHDFRRQWQEARANSREAAMFRPAEPWSAWEYFEHELTLQHAALWSLDATLITLAATAVVATSRSKTQLYSPLTPTPGP